MPIQGGEGGHPGAIWQPFLLTERNLTAKEDVRTGWSTMARGASRGHAAQSPNSVITSSSHQPSKFDLSKGLLELQQSSSATRMLVHADTAAMLPGAMLGVLMVSVVAAFQPCVSPLCVAVISWLLGV